MSRPIGTTAFWVCEVSTDRETTMRASCCSSTVIDSTTISLAVRLIGTEFPLDVDLIERLEIIRGSSSSLYGSSAFFGVINVITKDLKGLEVTGSVGSFGTGEGRLSYGQTFGNGLDVMLSGSGYDSRGHKRLYFKEFDAPETNNGIAENADSDESKKFFGKMKFADFTLQGMYGERDKAIPTASFETVFNDPRSRTLEKVGKVCQS